MDCNRTMEVSRQPYSVVTLKEYFVNIIPFYKEFGGQGMKYKDPRFQLITRDFLLKRSATQKDRISLPVQINLKPLSLFLLSLTVYRVKIYRAA